MESRVKNNYTENKITENTTNSTRSSRNSKLYKHVYENYEELDNLPIEDNTNEIDMEKLKELISSNNLKKENKEIKENLNILEQRKRQIDEQKIYDINKILEKAKYENSKLKEPTSLASKPKRNILSTLQSTELSLEEIRKAQKESQSTTSKIKTEQKKEEELTMTREIKYKNLIEQKTEENSVQTESNDNDDISFDLFEELKPTGNTIITKPIKNDNTSTNVIKNDIRSGDTSDIDIIKDTPYNTANDFFTNSYEFSKKDFADPEEEDFFEEPKKGGLLKIILLLFAIMIFVGVIIYFVGTYGLGI